MRSDVEEACTHTASAPNSNRELLNTCEHKKEDPLWSRSRETSITLRMGSNRANWQPVVVVVVVVVVIVVVAVVVVGVVVGVVVVGPPVK